MQVLTDLKKRTLEKLAEAKDFITVSQDRLILTRSGAGAPELQNGRTESPGPVPRRARGVSVIVERKEDNPASPIIL